MALSDFIQDDYSFYQANWLPVQYEPIAGSGESYTIAIAAYSNTDTDHRVIRTLSDKALNCLFVDRQKEVKNQIEWVLETLEIALENNQLMEWEPPLSGFKKGRYNETYAHSMLDVVNQAIAQSTILFTQLDSFKDLEYTPKHRFGVQVRQKIITLNPELQPYVNRPLKEMGLNFSIDFYNETYAAGLSTINKSGATDAVIGKIVKLGQIQKHINPNVNAEILIHPQNKQTISPKKFDNAMNYIHQVAEDFNDIKILLVSTKQNAAKHIVENALKQA